MKYSWAQGPPVLARGLPVVWLKQKRPTRHRTSGVRLLLLIEFHTGCTWNPYPHLGCVAGVRVNRGHSRNSFFRMNFFSGTRFSVHNLGTRNKRSNKYYKWVLVTSNDKKDGRGLHYKVDSQSVWVTVYYNPAVVCNMAVLLSMWMLLVNGVECRVLPGSEQQDCVQCVRCRAQCVLRKCMNKQEHDLPDCLSVMSQHIPNRHRHIPYIIDMNFILV